MEDLLGNIHCAVRFIVDRVIQMARQFINMFLPTNVALFFHLIHILAARECWNLDQRNPSQQIHFALTLVLLRQERHRRGG